MLCREVSLKNSIIYSGSPFLVSFQSRAYVTRKLPDVVTTTMSKDFAELAKTLIEGQRRSMQGSYKRRQPAAGAIPFLLQARSGLKEYVEEHDRDVQAWRLLSQAEECLLNYVAARRCLERAMHLSERKDKKDLKRFALLKEYENQWADLNLTPVELEELGNHLRPRLLEKGCDHTLRLTQQWMATVGKTKGVIDGLRNLGGYCDCEVLSNVVSG